LVSIVADDEEEEDEDEEEGDGGATFWVMPKRGHTCSRLSTWPDMRAWSMTRHTTALRNPSSPLACVVQPPCE
jgi:hypothetical protein